MILLGELGRAEEEVVEAYSRVLKELMKITKNLS
jgi:hypothetical protein